MIMFGRRSKTLRRACRNLTLRRLELPSSGRRREGGIGPRSWSCFRSSSSCCLLSAWLSGQFSG